MNPQPMTREVLRTFLANAACNWKTTRVEVDRDPPRSFNQLLEDRLDAANRSRPPRPSRHKGRRARDHQLARLSV